MYEEYKAGTKYAGKDAQQSPDIGAFKDAGYILTEDDLIVDIDSLSHEQIRALIDWFGIKTEVVWTDRGAHLYFKKPLGFRGAKSNTALGFPVEYKHISNTQAITVKRNGIAREVENHGTRQRFPDIFKPIRKAETLLGLDDGDGRNDALFKHRKIIGQYSNWKNILEFINVHIFASPLPDSEMEELTRDMAVEAVKDGEGIIAEIVAKQLKVVKYGGQLWFRPNSVKWYNNDQDELKRLIYGYCEGQKTRYVQEVFDQIKLKTKPIEDDKTFDIRLKNGILRSGKFIDIISDDFTPFDIELEYHEDAKPVQMVDDYLNNLSGDDLDYRKMIEEIIGYALFTDKEVIRLIGKFFFFVGDGGNGKGTLLEIIRKIVGSDNAGSLSIDQIADERYSNSLAGKLVNLGDDVEDKPIDDKKMKILKNISTADNMSLRKLYENSSTTALSTTLIFTTNHVLKSFEKGESYKRRVVWCPMFGKPKHKSKTFITDITKPEALEYWIKLIVDGYKRLYKNMSFTESKAVDEYNKHYHEENNSVIEYLEFTEEKDIIGKTSPDAYEEYESWAITNDYNVQSKRLFRETLKSSGIDLKLKKINGKVNRVFQKSDKG